MAFDNAHIKAEALSGLDGIDHRFFTRLDGVSEGIFKGRNIGLGSADERDAVLENRARCTRDLGVELNMLATPYQIHSDIVIVVDDVWDQGKGPRADGVVTNRPGVMAGIATADCGPVLFADETAGVIGATHAGWRGATSGVLENTVIKMEELGADRSNIVAVLGPTIAQSSYEVGPEFVERLREITDRADAYFVASERENHAMFDLQGYICDRLETTGVGRVASMGLDTYADEERFYSFRRTTHRGEDDYGRLLSAIVLRG